ncbi:hypothetical protein [Pseudomonas aeruginosa]|uniref:hypothetical protein n=1 Tax=Pseudomonas aeruginosa TaxID=287 RepID=UPI001360844F|nr:hypothetical protein [Pseudomonas aeruginosa]MBM2500572.1 hypothetical protein [Pseudomonas aeruginosa]MWW08796.1 hypothetical protein [Pseudomonas aeruginosa]
MELEVGQQYITRNGSIVTIEHEDGDYPYKFFGLIFGRDDHLGRIAYFASNGQYNITKETVFDIVNVVPKNVCS